MLKEMKQLKTNNLEGGMWPFSYFFGSSETSQQVADSTDGTYLVFYIDEEKINTFKEEYEKNKSDEINIANNFKEFWNYFETVKKFTQNSYDEEQKIDIKFFNKEQFKNFFDKKAYILTKNGKKITSTIISTDNDNTFVNDLLKVQNFQNKIEELIEKNNKTALTCHTDIINNIQQDINTMKIDNSEYNQQFANINRQIDSFVVSISANESNTKTSILDILEKLKQEYNQVLIKMNKSIYAPSNYDTNIIWKDALAESNIDFILDEIKSRGVKEIDNKEKIKPNMIIKINNDDPLDYKYAETIKKNTISITNMYTLLVSLIELRRYTRTFKETKRHLGSA
jgi:hypothetical protein